MDKDPRLTPGRQGTIAQRAFVMGLAAALALSACTSDDGERVANPTEAFSAEERPHESDSGGENQDQTREYRLLTEEERLSGQIAPEVLHELVDAYSNMTPAPEYEAGARYLFSEFEDDEGKYQINLFVVPGNHGYRYSVHFADSNRVDSHRVMITDTGGDGIADKFFGSPKVAKDAVGTMMSDLYGIHIPPEVTLGYAYRLAIEQLAVMAADSYERVPIDPIVPYTNEPVITA